MRAMFVTFGVYIFGETHELNICIDADKKYTHDEFLELAKQELLMRADFDNPFHNEETEPYIK